MYHFFLKQTLKGTNLFACLTHLFSQEMMIRRKPWNSFQSINMLPVKTTNHLWRKQQRKRYEVGILEREPEYQKRGKLKEKKCPLELLMSEKLSSEFRKDVLLSGKNETREGTGSLSYMEANASFCVCVFAFVFD